MESAKDKIFEQKVPVLGCVFIPLGILMAGLMLILIAASMSEFHWQAILVIVIVGYLAYFCFLRTSISRIVLGIYPSHITIDHENFPWTDIKRISFRKERIRGTINVDINKRKYVLLDVFVLSFLSLICIFTMIGFLVMPGNNSIRMLGIVVLAFALIFREGKVRKPGRRVATVAFDDLETVFHLLKYYTDIHQIPLEYKEERK